MTRRSPTRPSVAVVMPVLDGLRFLRKSLPPLAAALGADVEELVIVDDGCSDGSAVYAASLGARILTSSGRTGPAAARNLGAAACTAEIVFFVDADVVVHANALALARERLRDPELVAVFGAYDDRPPDAGFFSRWKNLQHHYVHSRAPGDAGTFWTGCGAVRREAFEAVGGFDVARFPLPSIEDIDLGYRLRAQGGRIALDPGIRATHLKRWELGDLLRTDILRRALPWSRLLQSRSEARDELNVQPGERARAALAGGWFVSVLGAALPGIGPASAVASVALLAAAAVANAQLLTVFLRRHGLLFACGGALFLQVYYLYASATWAYALFEARLPAGFRAGR